MDVLIKGPGAKAVGCFFRTVSKPGKQWTTERAQVKRVPGRNRKEIK